MSTPMKQVEPTRAQKAFRHALLDVMKQHGAELKAEELLAVAAHLVGQLIAMQDQRTMTPAMAMQLVGQNIERGNLEAIDNLLLQTGGRA